MLGRAGLEKAHHDLAFIALLRCAVRPKLQPLQAFCRAIRLHLAPLVGPALPEEQQNNGGGEEHQAIEAPNASGGSEHGGARNEPFPTQVHSRPSGGWATLRGGNETTVISGNIPRGRGDMVAEQPADRRGAGPPGHLP